MSQVSVFLGLGSNIAPEDNLIRAVDALRQQFNQVKLSAVYESEAVGFKGDNFLNCVAAIESDLLLSSLIEEIKNIEDRLGRRRGGAKFSSRLIDIDILTYGDWVCTRPIVLPREEITQNAYVLRPFAELAPDFILPGSGKSLGQLWQAFDQQKQPLKYRALSFSE